MIKENATVQMLGLNGPQGFTRLVLALLAKFDPEHKGITLTAADAERALEVAVTQRRQNISINANPDDSILIRLQTDEESEEEMNRVQS